MDLTAAYNYAARKHRHQTRADGITAYIEHCKAVAFQVYVHVHGMDDGPQLIQAAFLHDVLEDTDATEEELRLRFGDEITDLVVELTKDKGEQRELGQDTTEYLVTMMLRMSERALTIKLCDRYANIRDLQNQSDKEFTTYYLDSTKKILESVGAQREGITMRNTHIINDLNHLIGQYRTLEEQ